MFVSLFGSSVLNLFVNLSFFIVSPSMGINAYMRKAFIYLNRRFTKFYNLFDFSLLTSLIIVFF